MVCNDLDRWSFSFGVGQEIKNQSTSDWLVGNLLNSPLE